MAGFWTEAVKIDIITIFPGYFSPLGVSLLGKAAERGLIELTVHDLRTWAHDVHRSVDDAPFGGGPGMVMSPAPWGEALDAVLGSPSPSTRLVVPTPTGVRFRQETAATYSRMAHLVFACGRYEGIDARFTDEARTRVPVDEVSIGDYVLSGDHGAIARWRRDEALRRTAALRPDLMAALPPDALDDRDREVLQEAGFPISGEDMAH